jgi:ribonuclease P protein component
VAAVVTGDQNQQGPPSKVPGRRRERLSYSQRLHDPKDFQRVYNAQNVVRAQNVVLFFAPNGMPQSRLGVSVGTKYGNAVRRNRIKRVFRAAFRKCQKSLPASFDYVLVPRMGVKEYSTAEVERSLRGMLKKIIVQEPKPAK